MSRSTYRPSGYGAPRIVFPLRGPHVSPQIGLNGRWDPRCWDCSQAEIETGATPLTGVAEAETGDVPCFGLYDPCEKGISY